MRGGGLDARYLAARPGQATLTFSHGSPCASPTVNGTITSQVCGIQVFPVTITVVR